MPKDGLYSKYLIFNAVSPSTLTEVDSYGFNNITLAMDGNNIKITSSAEFTGQVFIDDNQESSSELVDTSTIIYTPTPHLNWGTLQGEIVCYD